MDDDKKHMAQIAETLNLVQKEEDEVARLSALGLSPRDIAVAMELNPTRRAAFIALASIPGTEVARLIEMGRANGRITPQLKLQEAAATGNIEAIRTLDKIQRNNRYNEFIHQLDDDEFTL
ncbi:MAG: hypothetical protein J6C44_10045 [Muribaculaceae bacterium]|nr:hypothetical protein [Muribaculaceae bacterium]